MTVPEAGRGTTVRPPPRFLRTRGLDDYALIDAGGGRKLERFGAVTLNRPEEQALFRPRVSEETWDAAGATFDGKADEDGVGRWRRRDGLPESWVCRHGPVRFACRFTSFRHVGAFPEQAAHWAYMRDRLAGAAGAPELLNLFAYTGIASLIAADAGATVTHVDASRTAVAWAKENQFLSEMEDRPIRWIVDDAMKFAAREVRRRRRYDGILLDPPKFGRGPKNEIWRLFDDLPRMLALCRDLMKPDGFIVLTAYAIRASFVALDELVTDVFGPGAEAGELVLESESGRALSTSLYCRWPAA